MVRAGNATRKVLVEDIYYVESSNRKVILSLSHEKIIYYGKIGQLEEEFPKSFFRVHKGYLVNMKNGDVLLISKYKYQEFVKAYLDYILEENY